MVRRRTCDDDAVLQGEVAADARIGGEQEAVRIGGDVLVGHFDDAADMLEGVHAAEFEAGSDHDRVGLAFGPGVAGREFDRGIGVRHVEGGGGNHADRVRPEEGDVVTRREFALGGTGTGGQRKVHARGAVVGFRVRHADGVAFLPGKDAFVGEGDAGRNFESGPDGRADGGLHGLLPAAAGDGRCCGSHHKDPCLSHTATPFQVRRRKTTCRASARRFHPRRWRGSSALRGSPSS